MAHGRSPCETVLSSLDQEGENQTPVEDGEHLDRRRWAQHKPDIAQRC